jgi:hypothetical protein
LPHPALHVYKLIKKIKETIETWANVIKFVRIPLRYIEFLQHKMESIQASLETLAVYLSHTEKAVGLFSRFFKNTFSRDPEGIKYLIYIY